MTRRLSTALFLLCFVVWAGLELQWRGQHEGVQDILFWIGMGCVLLSTTSRPAGQRVAH
jgi:hypothetical protein